MGFAPAPFYCFEFDGESEFDVDLEFDAGPTESNPLLHTTFPSPQPTSTIDSTTKKKI